MAKRALILQHMHDDGPGRFDRMLRDDGYALDVVHVDRQDIPALGAYDLMLVLGGAMNVWQEAEHPWLTAEKQAIAEWAGARARPYIGICLGHQLLADALGGEVGEAEKAEIGLHHVTIAEDHEHPFFEGVWGRQAVMQWHGAEITKVPEGATVLASSPATEVQSIAVGDHALGVQFHFEWTLDWIKNWPADWLEALVRAKGEGAHEAVIADATPHMDGFGAMSERIYSNFKAVTGA